MNRNWVSGKNLSEAWAKAFLRVSRANGNEIVPLVVSVPTTFGTGEDPRIRAVADKHLSECGLHLPETVANTIFPYSLWNPEEPRQRLYDRFDRIWPKLQKISANRNGTYFRRLTAFEGQDESVNQLEHLFTTYVEKGNHRRSALQLALFDPRNDHVHNRQRGFPCLHQVAITPTADGTLAITGFYATQTIFEKAYGNYLGLIRLGEFIAKEMGMTLSQMTCIASVAKLSQVGGFRARRQEICSELSKIVGPAL